MIDNDLVAIVMQRYRLKTKTEAVDKALRHLAGQPLTREEILAYEGANLIGEAPGDRFDHDPH